MSQSFFTRILLALDDWRVRQHFKRVERLLRARDVSHLPNALQAARVRQLDELHRYATRGVFPRNHEQKGYAPCFIDRDGRECAVAHLVMADGGIATAYRIADITNYAYVPEMKFLELDVWAADTGLTREELALIQPTYIPPELRDTVPQLNNFAVVGVMILSVMQLTTVVGAITSSVNIVKLRRRKAGRIAAFVGLIVGAVLLLLGLSLGNRLQTGTALLIPFSSLQPPMIDFEVSFARSVVEQGWPWMGGALLVALLCVAVSAARLVMHRRLARQA